MTEVDGPDPQLAEPQIAMFCGRQMLHMNLQTGQWEPDLWGRQSCFKDPHKILSYCQEVGSRLREAVLMHPSLTVHAILGCL